MAHLMTTGRKNGDRTKLETGNRVLKTDDSYRRSSFVTSVLGLLVLGIGTCVLYDRFRGQPVDPVRLLSDQLNKSLRQKDYEQAARDVSSLLEKSPGNREHLYQQAVIETNRGHAAEAQRIIDNLITLKEPKAALWLLEKEYVQENDGTWDDHKRHRFDELTRVAMNTAVEEERLRAQEILARHQLVTSDFAGALESYAAIAPANPRVGLHAASLALKLGDPKRAKMLAAQAQRFFEIELKRQSRDDAARLQLAHALVLQGQEAEAVKLLSDGFQLTRQAKLQQAAGEAMVLWAKRLASDSSPEATRLPRLRLVHRASQCAPSDPAVLEGVLNLIREFQQSPAERAEELRAAIARGIDRESAHFMLGTLQVLQSDSDAGQLSLQLAKEAGTHVPTLFNNLALAILSGSAGQAEEALSLIDAANKQLPGQAHFSETRGRVLMRLERWEEAIVELKRGLAVENLRPIIHSNLAVAYRKLGNESQAREFEVVR